MVIFLIPDFFSKYKSKITGQGIVEKKDGIIQFEDVNNDGFSEQIISFSNTEGKAGIKITNHNNQITDSWNFDGQLIPRGYRLICGDYDHSGKNRIFFFIQNNDSLNLACVIPGQSSKILFKKYISRLNVHNNQYDYGITSLFLIDLNHDGFKDVLFNVMSGFSLQPRRIFSYDIHNDTVFSSPLCGSLLQIMDIFDINKDGYPEIFCDSKAPQNYSDTSKIPFPDCSAWLVILNNNLNFLFPPREFKGFTSDIYALPFVYKNNGEIACVYVSHEVRSTCTKLLLYDLNGKILNYKTLPIESTGATFDFVSLESNRTKLYKISTDGWVRQMDNNFNPIENIVITNLHSSRPSLFDIDNDGYNELVFTAPTQNQLIIARNDFSNPIELEIVLNKAEPIEMSIKKNGKDHPELFLQCGNQYYYCAYYSNPWYFFKYPFYLIVYVSILLFIILINRIQKIVLQQRYNAKKKISELQLVVLKNQIDPHFTFNVLTSISSLVIQEKPDIANKQISLLSKLIRDCVDTSDKIYRTINDEIEFVKNFLAIEKARKIELFDYEIVISPDVNISWLIPKMIVHIFVENALKHGIRPRGHGGKINISVSCTKKDMIFIVQDNGIGRKAAIVKSLDSTHKGIYIIDQIFFLLNQYNSEKLSYEIIDMENILHEPTGTKVVLTVPINMKYIIYE